MASISRPPEAKLASTSRPPAGHVGVQEWMCRQEEGATHREATVVRMSRALGVSACAAMRPLRSADSSRCDKEREGKKERCVTGRLCCPAVRGGGEEGNACVCVLVSFFVCVVPL